MTPFESKLGVSRERVYASLQAPFFIDYSFPTHGPKRASHAGRNSSQHVPTYRDRKRHLWRNRLICRCAKNRLSCRRDRAQRLWRRRDRTLDKTMRRSGRVRLARVGNAPDRRARRRQDALSEMEPICQSRTLGVRICASCGDFGRLRPPTRA